MLTLPAAADPWAHITTVLNFLTQPSIFLTLSTIAFVLMLVLYRLWTKPAVATGLFLLFCFGYFGLMANENFFQIVKKPDNVPITIMLLTVMFFLWVSFRRAAVNDARIEAGMPLMEEDKDDKVLVWPDLVYTELICLVAASAGLIIWAIISKAPLEQPATPAYAPNPAKAPWYFLGLQEMLVYFDPWMAGVVYPGLIIAGLMAMPFIDTNPRGNGYYTLKERPFAISTWLFGFLILWVVLIFFGTFLRGPNWSFYGPTEFWDPHKPDALNNVNVSDFFWNTVRHSGLPRETTNPISPLPVWIAREWLGFLLIGAYLFVTPALLRATVMKRQYEQMGGIRYTIMVMLLLFMALMPIKMVLRWLFNLKYFWFLPEFNASL